MSDLIDRQAAIELLSDMRGGVNCFDDRERMIYNALSQAIEAVKDLPSAQPEERTKERTKTHACDCINRQAAIDALHMHLMYRMGTDSNKKRLDEWINNLPSAQHKGEQE